MSEDRRTKSDILRELERVQEALAVAESRIPRKPEPIPAAQALEGCIRALELIPRKRGQSLYNNLDGSTSVDKAEVENVLRHLMSRYGLDFTVRVEEPCHRVHLEDAPDEVIIDRLRGRF